MPRRRAATAGICERTSAAGRSPTADWPPPDRRSGSAGCRGPGRWRSRSGARGLFRAPHHDPVELAAHQPSQPCRLRLPLRRDRRQRLFRFAQARAGLGSVIVANSPQDLDVGRLPQPGALERRAAGQQLVKHARPANRCRCASRCPARPSRPARGSCIRACR